MRKQTLCFVEPGDIIYLIDDNFDIKQVELYPHHLDVSLYDRARISDEVDTISGIFVLGSPEIKDDQLDLLEVYLETNDFGSLIQRHRLADTKAFTTEEAAEAYLMTKIDKHRIARMILKEVNEELDIRLTEIGKILKKFSDRLREFDVPEDVLLNSNLCKISELCDLLDLDQAEILHLNKE